MEPLMSRIWSWITGSSAKEKQESFFIKNGSELVKDLIASCEGKYHPFRSFTAEKIISMTNNFREPKQDLGYGCNIYEGCFENRKVLVLIYFHNSYSLKSKYMINDIVSTSRVSHHRNVLKLLGCCLEFANPTLVYEYPTGGEILSDLIYDHTKFEPLRWESRLKIARDIAGVLVYLHTAFPTPIIFRYLTPDNIVVGETGVAKIFDLSYSIPLPPGKFEIEDVGCGSYGYSEPEYLESGIVTTKIDVYNFGVFLLVLLTGLKVKADKDLLVEFVTDLKEFVGEGRLKKIVDPTILLSDRIIGGDTKYGQMQAFLELADRCINERGDRPEMLDVAKELKRIEEIIQ